jgi:primosomal replication protein N
VGPGNEFKATSRQEIKTGLEHLWTLEKGECSKKNGAVELVWFNMPLPKVVSGEQAATYNVHVGSCLGVGGGGGSNRDRGKAADGGWRDGGGGADGGTATGVSRSGRGLPSLEAGDQVSGDCGSGGKKTKVRVLWFLIF